MSTVRRYSYADHPVYTTALLHKMLYNAASRVHFQISARIREKPINDIERYDYFTGIRVEASPSLIYLC